MDEFEAARRVEGEMFEIIRQLDEEEARFRADAEHVRENMKVLSRKAAPIPFDGKPQDAG